LLKDRGKIFDEAYEEDEKALESQSKELPIIHDLENFKIEK